MKIIRLLAILLGLLVNQLYLSKGSWDKKTGFMNCSAWKSEGTDLEDFKKFRLSNYGKLQNCINAHPYDVKQFPLWKTDSALPYEISFAISLREVITLKASGEIVLVIFASFLWEDQYRLWDTNEIPVGEIMVPSSDVWYPRFALENCESEDCVLSPGADSLIRLYDDGWAKVDIRKIFHAKCMMDFDNFPLDKARCKLEFFLIQRPSATLTKGNPITLNNDLFAKKYGKLTSEEWNVISQRTFPENISLTLESPVKTKTVIIPGFALALTLQRFPTYYIYNIVLPIAILSAIGLLTVLLPPSSDKINLAVTVLLGFFFVQTITGALFPQTDNMPLLAKYTISALLFTGLNLIASLVIFAVSNFEFQGTPPRLVHYSLYFISLLMCYPLKKMVKSSSLKKISKDDQAERTDSEHFTKTTEEDIKIEENPKMEESQGISNNYWKEAAVVMNRFFGFCYLLGVILNILIFLLPIFLED